MSRLLIFGSVVTGDVGEIEGCYLPGLIMVPRSSIRIAEFDLR